MKKTYCISCFSRLLCQIVDKLRQLGTNGFVIASFLVGNMFSYYLTFIIIGCLQEYLQKKTRAQNIEVWPNGGQFSYYKQTVISEIFSKPNFLVVLKKF